MPLIADKEVRGALRQGAATVICTILVESFGLQFGYLGVMTVNMVMNQFPFTSFQKGVERVVGRGLGIVYGLLLLTLFNGAPVLGAALELLGLVIFFYIHFSGRLAYTFLNCGLYLAAITQIGHADLASAYTSGLDIFLAILIGVIVADLVNWLTKSESSLAIRPGGNPLLPLRGDWLNHSLMLTVTVVLTQTVTRLADLPVNQSVISVMMISITSDEQTLMRKGRDRLLGAALGFVWGMGSWLVLARLPHFPLLLGFMFVGMFLAGYIARASKTMGYVGLQMGMVIAIVLLVPPAHLGTADPALQRMEGVFIGLVISVLVSSLWPGFKAAPDPVPAAPKASAVNQSSQ